MPELPIKAQWVGGSLEVPLVLDAETLSSSGLYLFHFEPRYAHAGHYLGYADDVYRCVCEHLSSNGRSSPLVRAALSVGSDVTLVRVWVGGDRSLERRLKRQGGLSRHCPICRATGSYHR